MNPRTKVWIGEVDNIINRNDIETILKNIERKFNDWYGDEDDMATVKTNKVNKNPTQNTTAKTEQKEDNVNHPKWYGSKDDPYETIKVIQAWGLNFTLGNALKYISRAGKKDPTKTVEDLKKALFYLQYEIDRLEGEIVHTTGEETIGGTFKATKKDSE